MTATADVGCAEGVAAVVPRRAEFQRPGLEHTDRHVELNNRGVLP